MVIESFAMKYTVEELRTLSKAVMDRDYEVYSALVHRRQPGFCEIIDEIAYDPRCVTAHRFCIIFCGLAFAFAEMFTGVRIPKFSDYAIHEISGFIARGDVARIGKRACSYRERIRRHVLTRERFDEEDTEWLCTTLATFCYLVEKALEESRKRAQK